MAYLEFREPVSSITHCTWFVLSIPATALLLWSCRRDCFKQLALLVYGLSLSFCFAGSTLYHGVRVADRQIEWYVTIDYIGIFLLIAGTVTPVALIILRGAWRWGLFTSVWLLALTGITLRLYGVPLSRFASTGIYIGMGWAVLLCTTELIRRVPPRSFVLVVLGGVVYTIGAMLNHAQWPEMWPGVFSAHELFHLFVMAASLCQYLFMLRVVAPYLPRTETVPAWRPALPRRILVAPVYTKDIY